MQHASADVEKMVLGNKCDINDKRQVSKDRGEQVRSLIFILCRGLVVFIGWDKKHLGFLLYC